MLKIQDLQVTIASAPILRGVNLQVPNSAMAGLIGRNGAGKTTLLRSIMGLVKTGGGQIDFEHSNLMQVQAHKRVRLGIGYMPEDRKLVPDFSTEENILLPAWASQLKDARNRLEWIYRLMPEVEKFAQQKAQQLSGGQQKLVALARALLCGQRLLLLDEPFEGLAPALARRLGEVLAALKDQGISVLIAESNDVHVADLLDYTFVIERGEIAQQPHPATRLP